MPCCDKHDRLDLKLSVHQYTSPECGALNEATGKPEYCCFECPVLQEKLKA